MLQLLRPPLVAGTIAALGAAALTVLPVGSPAGLATPAAPSTAQTALTGFSNPIEQLLASGEIGENYVFGRYYNGGDVPTPDAGEGNWPYAGFDQAGGDLLNYLLYQEYDLGYYTYVGFLPNFAAEAYLPAVQQLQINIEDYISVVLSGLNFAATDLAVGVWELPSAVVNALQLALQGQIPAAISAISDAVLGPIVAAGQSVLAAGSYVLSNVVARAGAVVAALPQILTTFAGSVIGGASVLAQKTAAIVVGVVTSLASLNIEGAWNAAVDGLLGPSGIPGALFNLFTGAGVQTGPIVNPATDIAANFVPSIRTSFQAAQWTIRAALETTPMMAAASPASARAAQPAPAASGTGDADASGPSADSPSRVEAGEAGGDTAAVTGGGASNPVRAAGSDRKAASREGASRAGSDRAGRS